MIHLGDERMRDERHLARVFRAQLVRGPYISVCPRVLGVAAHKASVRKSRRTTQRGMYVGIYLEKTTPVQPI